MSRPASAAARAASAEWLAAAARSRAAALAWPPGPARARCLESALDCLASAVWWGGRVGRLP